MFTSLVPTTNFDLTPMQPFENTGKYPSPLSVSHAESKTVRRLVISLSALRVNKHSYPHQNVQTQSVKYPSQSAQDCTRDSRLERKELQRGINNSYSHQIWTNCGKKQQYEVEC